MRLQLSLRDLIEQITGLLTELDRLCGWEIEHRLGPPANAGQIAVIERLAGFQLPPDYRAFLELHNGWHGFSGEHDLLSAEQMTSAPMARSIARTRALQVETADPAAAGFVIYASVSGSDIAYIDPATRRPGGMADVVQWDPLMSEYARFGSFVAYLQGQVEVLEHLIAKERLRLR
jgi:cell wall assembly regulator SMI1